MNTFKAVILLLITLNLAKAQTGCVPAGSDTDLQLLPGCTLHGVLEKLFSGLKKILTEVTEANKEDCSTKLQQTFDELYGFVSKCIDGICNDNLLYQVLEIKDPKKITLAELFATYNISESDIKALLSSLDHYWAEVCPFNEKVQQLLNTLKGASNFLPTNSKEAAQSLEQVLKMLLGSKDAYETKSVGVSNCDFFKNQTSLLVDTIYSTNVLNSTISMSQTFLQNTTFGGATKIVKMVMNEAKANLDMIGCSLNSGVSRAVPNIMILMIFVNFLWIIYV